MRYRIVVLRKPEGTLAEVNKVLHEFEIWDEGKQLIVESSAEFSTERPLIEDEEQKIKEITAKQFGVDIEKVEVKAVEGDTGKEKG